MQNILILLFVTLCVLCKGQAEFAPELNRTTGTFTNTGPPLQNVLWVYPNERAFDENTGTYFFPCAQNHSLISVNMANGAVIASPSITNIWQLQFNKSTNKLHGLLQNNGNNTKNLVVVDPATAAYTVIGNPISGSSLFQGCLSGMDDANNIYTFIDPTNILYSLDATTGSVIASPTLVLSAGENIYNIEFDNSTLKLFGILYNSNSSTFFLCSINKQTGIVTSIGPGSPIGSGTGSGAIDEAAQQYLFLSGSGYSLTTFNLATGNPVFNSVITMPNCINFTNLIFDNNKSKLYCIYWNPSYSVGLSDNLRDKNDSFIYPTQNGGSFKVQINSNLANGEIVILNSIGQKVFEQEVVEGENFIEANGLVSGLYSYIIFDEGQKTTSGKLMLER